MGKNWIGPEQWIAFCNNNRDIVHTSKPEQWVFKQCNGHFKLHLKYNGMNVLL